MSAAFKRGFVFRDTYKVEEKLEGSKIAYKVTHLTLKTTFVVEQFMDLVGADQLDLGERQKVRKTFAERRARVQQYAEFSHPSLVRVVDQFEVDGLHFLVRDWVEGMPLKNYVASSLKPLSPETTLEFAAQLLDLLQHLGEEQPPLVLGTLCSEYLVVMPDGELKVVDLGLGEHQPGKADYEPFGCPELLGGGELDGRADLYSLGAVLYYCLTGSELPPIWDRITLQHAIPSPLDLGVKVSAPVWNALERMLSLQVNVRPQSVEEVRSLLAEEDFVETPENSPGTWYPEQEGLMLADSYPFAPIQREDWILKVVQAATVGRARQMAVSQTREACLVEMRMAATDVPTPKSVIGALTSDAPVANPMVLELAAALRTVGEFCNFSVNLDDWKQSWTLSCVGGQIQTTAHESAGRAGVFLTVYYDGKSVERARQAANEVVRLHRKTRLCPVPITVGKKPLEPGRGIEVSELSREVAELYLASASFPEQGTARLVSEPDNERDPLRALTVFKPSGGAESFCHVDVRCYVAPGEGVLHDVMHTGYHFMRLPSRVLWYRHGVLCGEQHLEKKWPLQLDIHLNGDHLTADNSGLKVRLPEYLQASRLKPLQELERLLPLTRMKLTEHWEDHPGKAAPKTQAFAGMVGAPLLLFFVANLVSPGFLFLNTAKMFALMKASAVMGGSTGYLTASDHVDAVRKTCLKAIDLFEKEGIPS